MDSLAHSQEPFADFVAEIKQPRCLSSYQMCPATIPPRSELKALLLLLETKWPCAPSLNGHAQLPNRTFHLVCSINSLVFFLFTTKRNSPTSDILGSVSTKCKNVFQRLQSEFSDHGTCS